MTAIPEVGALGFASARERATVRRAAAGVLCALRCRRLGVEVSAAPPEEMRRMNFRFRGSAAGADVLSFASPSGDPGGGTGEVLLCPDRIGCRFGRGGRYLRRLAELTVHGVLHVLGYHHSDPEAGRQMFALQRAILRKVSL